MVYRIVVGLFMVITGLLVFSSCATMKKEECLTADWYQIGYEDGTQGYPIARVGKHRKACSKYNVAPDFELYQRGRDEGLFKYCTPHQGYHLGLSGRKYNDVCAPEFRFDFQTAYNQGRDIYLFQQKVKKEERDQEKRIREIEGLEEEIASKEASLSTDCKDQNVCKKALNDIRELDREIERLASEIRFKDDEIRSMKQTLVDMKNQHRY